MMLRDIAGPGFAGLTGIGTAAMLAACAQTVSGFGMNLILAPVAQLLLPGAAAVRLVTGAAAILNSALIVTGRRSILWRPVLYLVIPALAATFLLGPAIRGSGARPLGVIVAAVTILAVAASAWSALPVRLTGLGGALIAGALSGVLNVSSGVNGPPIAVYTATQPWPPGQLVATVQAVFLPVNIAAFVVLGVPMSAGICCASAAGTGAGLLAGMCLRERIPGRLVRRAVLVIAAIGAALVLARAVMG